MGIVKVIVFKSVYASCVQVMVVEDFHKYPPICSFREKSTSCLDPKTAPADKITSLWKIWGGDKFISGSFDYGSRHGSRTTQWDSNVDLYPPGAVDTCIVLHLSILPSSVEGVLAIPPLLYCSPSKSIRHPKTILNFLHKFVL